MGGKAPQFRLSLYLYRWSSRHFSPFYSPYPKPPVLTCGPPRLLGGFTGLSRINIAYLVLWSFTLFWVIFDVKTAKNETELTFTILSNSTAQSKGKMIITMIEYIKMLFQIRATISYIKYIALNIFTT